MTSITAVSGHIRKLKTTQSSPVQYELPIGDELVSLNDLIGEHITLYYTGEIRCIHCDRKTNKSFNQGYCFPCARSLAQCDMCIVKPEKCHYFEGTCREPEWGDTHCMQPHIVYLANSSGLKVGITRHSQVPTRWMDQGAVQALPIAKVQTRQQSGFLEIAFAKHVADKTNWRALLKGVAEPIDLVAARDKLLVDTAAEIASLKERFGESAIEFIDAEVQIFNYPVSEYPTTIKSHNFDKTAEVTGELVGIKGQYLMLSTGVLNIRKFAGYHLSLQ